MIFWLVSMARLYRVLGEFNLHPDLPATPSPIALAQIIDIAGKTYMIGHDVPQTPSHTVVSLRTDCASANTTFQIQPLKK
jgi:hypothetical protein